MANVLAADVVVQPRIEKMVDAGASDAAKRGSGSVLLGRSGRLPLAYVGAKFALAETDPMAGALAE